MFEKIKEIINRMKPMSIEERRHAHRMILMSSGGLAGASMKVEGDGFIHVGHEEAKDVEEDG